MAICGELFSRRPRGMLIVVLALAACGESHERGPSIPLAPKPPNALRFATWNIKSGSWSSLAEVGRRLASLEADVIVLQEVDRNTKRSGNIDQAEKLAHELGMVSVFAEAIPLDGGGYGIAALAAFPLLESSQIPLSNAAAKEPRTALSFVTCSEALCLRVVNHHADTQEAAADRSAKEILDAVADHLGSGMLVAGDFNQTPGDPEILSFAEAGLADVVAERAPHATTFRDRRLDYVFADTALAPCVLGVSVPEALESDHNPVVIDFDPAQCTLRARALVKRTASLAAPTFSGRGTVSMRLSTASEASMAW